MPGTKPDKKGDKRGRYESEETYRVHLMMVLSNVPRVRSQKQAELEQPLGDLFKGLITLLEFQVQHAEDSRKQDREMLKEILQEKEDNDALRLKA